jgi:hypothetical protein
MREALATAPTGPVLVRAYHDAVRRMWGAYVVVGTCGPVAWGVTLDRAQRAAVSAWYAETIQIALFPDLDGAR